MKKLGREANVSNPKFKVESYQNLGGINSKFSPHLTSPLEFLDIKNFDFQTPGSLTQRWGSTQYMGQTLSGKITALSEYQKLDGTSYLIAGSTGGLWYGATTGQFQGMSLGALTSTQVMQFFTTTPPQSYGCFRSLGFYSAGGGATWGEQADQGVFYQGSSAQLIMNTAWNSSLSPYDYTIPAMNQSGNYASIEYFVDNAFIADGTKFIKFNGITTSNVGLPIPVSTTLMRSFNFSFGLTIIGWGGTGAAIFYLSYVNNRGFESNIMPMASVMGPFSHPTLIPMTSTGGGLTTVGGLWSLTMGVNTPLSYGISSINVYCYCQTTLGSSSTSEVFNLSDANTWNYPFVKIGNYPASGSTVSYVPIGTTFANAKQLGNNIGPLANPFSNQYMPLGVTFGEVKPSYYYPNNFSTAPVAERAQGYPHLYETRFYPQYLAVFDNRLFCAGFSAAPSSVYFSDVKEPEGFLPYNNFEVRTNDSDYITSLKAYQTRLYIFKRNSLHVLVGDSPTNFFVQEISNLYGCLNNRCSVLFDDVLIFLDRKGVFQYNGANLTYLSTKVQPIFDRMNYSAALTEACGTHDKLRNQVLFSIPVDGATTNNITIVYDYVAQAWTSHTGYNPSIYAEVKGYNVIKRLFYGDYNGRVNWTSASFLSDNGQGITLSYKTRYLHDMGDSVQKQFRRLYLNTDAISATITNKINFYQDYGNSIVLGTTLNLGAFQERIEYGISAKSLAYELITVNSTNSPLRIHGFTIESRMQRRV